MGLLGGMGCPLNLRHSVMGNSELHLILHDSSAKNVRVLQPNEVVSLENVASSGTNNKESLSE